MVQVKMTFAAYDGALIRTESQELYAVPEGEQRV